MNEKTIRKLVKLIEESQVDQIEVSSWWHKIRITRRLAGSDNNRHGSAVVAAAPVESRVPPSPAGGEVAAGPSPASGSGPNQVVETKAADADTKYVEIKSPMVGTFYAAPAPDAQPYVADGQRIEVGQVVCIVEAMKLMNEIEAETAGRVVKRLVENAQPVEFGQTLFLIDPNA